MCRPSQSLEGGAQMWEGVGGGVAVMTDYDLFSSRSSQGTVSLAPRVQAQTVSSNVAPVQSGLRLSVGRMLWLYRIIIYFQ